jgi:hypothetical protein
MDALPQGFPDLLDLFAHSLAEVRFGDLDAAALTSLAAEVSAAAEEVAAAESALETARAALAARQETLLVQANRALAYARVFAEADEPLLARVNAIVLPRSPRKSRLGLGVDAGAGGGAGASTSAGIDGELAARRPRGRPRKVVPDSSTETFDAEQQSLASTGE